jgi:hypothetical protein
MVSDSTHKTMFGGETKVGICRSQTRHSVEHQTADSDYDGWREQGFGEEFIGVGGMRHGVGN